MKIIKGQLVSIDDADIKEGVLKLPKKVKSISDDVIDYIEDLEKVIALGLKHIGNYNFYDCNALTSFEAPVLETIGNYNFRDCNALTSFEAPVLETIGNYNFYVCNALTSLKTKKHQFKIKCVDDYPFVIETEKSSKGYKIYSGFNLQSFNKKSLEKESAYVAEKDGFTAHGETIRKAISDVKFKIVSEKLKNEPIYEDTKITVKHYRLITGACDFGCREFMSKNNIPFKVVDEETVEEKPILAKDLLQILKKEGAYGLSRFQKLVQF